MLKKMIRAEDGHAVDVHPDMVADYMTGGYRLVKGDVTDGIQAEEETKTEAPAKAPVKRGRPPKVAK